MFVSLFSHHHGLVPTPGTIRTVPLQSMIFVFFRIRVEPGSVAMWSEEDISAIEVQFRDHSSVIVSMYIPVAQGKELPVNGICIDQLL